MQTHLLGLSFGKYSGSDPILLVISSGDSHSILTSDAEAICFLTSSFSLLITSLFSISRKKEYNVFQP